MSKETSTGSPDLSPGIEQDLMAALAAHAGAVDCAYWFGSAARGDAGPLSDLDVAVLFRDSVAAQERVQIASRIVDQVQRLEGPRLDVTILNDAAPALQHRVIRDGRVLFSGDERRRVAFETAVIREFLDFQPVLERYDRALLARAREGRLGV